MDDPQRILVIRRDNIGDLVLTTPFLAALRQQYPKAWIAVLANSYNAPVLDGYPDVDAVYTYDKAKHHPERSRLITYAGTVRTLSALRARRIDLAILAGAPPQREAARLARLAGARRTLGFGSPSTNPRTLSVPYGDGAKLHAAEDVFRLGAPLGLGGPPGSCRLAPNAAQAERVRAALAARGWQDRRVVAIHISARRPAQRWPAERFAQVISALGRAGDLAFLLLWSPGAADDPRHPGDDDKAAAVAALAGAAPLLAWPTATLAELNGALAVAHLMICADGGAMHVAVGLGVRVVALFGDSPVTRWRPWGRGHEVVRGPADSVDGIAAERVVAAAIGLLGAR